MPKSTSTILSIKLNNFLHRIDCKATVMALATQHDCSLKRIRRSKNWSLMGEKNQLIKLSEQLRKETATSENIMLCKIGWIAEAIEKSLPKLNYDLISIVQSHADMTINRLISETGCTLIEARIAFDNAEDLNN